MPRPSPPPSLPQPTPPPPSSANRKRRRAPHPSPDLVRRQGIFDQSQVDSAMAQCANTGNEIVSCFPTSDVTVPQHQLAYFVWNSRRPQLDQTNKVNVYLLHAGTNDIIFQWLDQDNPTTGDAGTVAAPVNDSWFPNGGTGWSGANITRPYYFVITRADQNLDGSQTPQSTFSAVQTTFADAVSSSLASVSTASVASVASISLAAESTRSVESVSVLSRSSLASVIAANPTAVNGSGNVQNGDGSNFPHWAIAVIVVLGFLAIVALGSLTFLFMRRLRQRAQYATAQRNSMGSASPMIPGGAAGSNARGDPQSPEMEEGSQRLYDPHVPTAGRAASFNTPNDDASMVSHAQSAAHSAGDSGLFSGADAAIMADAFRKVLRKPDFAGGAPIEEGESPESQEVPRQQDHRLMNWELAEEGRDIRSVGSSRGVRVETAGDNDGASTVHEQQH